ncbi:MAG: LamG-like jellyroll fold domain-containing protein [Limisphaerales bacterium]
MAITALAFATPARAFIFDTFGDGFWTVINQGNGNTLVVSGSGASQAVATNTAFQQQFEVLYNEQDGTFRLRNHDTWLCIGALNGGTTNGTPVVTVSSYTGAPSQKWNLVPAVDGYYQIENVASGLALQTDNGSPAKVTLATPSTSTYQYWSFSYQTHYPKKGMAGWDSQLPRFNASWLYNWGWTTSESLTNCQVFAPMQWGNWGVGTLNNVTEKPLCVLGFNEPDNSGQANMTTAQAIALWPQLQALNLPLISPACANDFGGWLSDFYNQVAANGYRVDYTAVHDYPGPSASGLMSTLNSAYTTWGRAVWLTEFSVVDWVGNATWSEQDNYRFLAEFMWQAEDQVWFKRYSLFLFSGTPSTNPWDGNGHRSDTFLNDNYTLTPFGELYAGWDADRTLRSNTPYFIHNCATCFRLTSSRNVTGPAASSIRHEDATTQWILTNAPTSGHYYIMSLADGRRVRYSASTLDLAPPGTTGAVVEWSFNGPDSNGYYFIDNPNGGVSLSGSGSGANITFSAVASGSPSDNTRWRFVKPYYPVSLAAANAPTGLSASAANRSVTLRWSGSAPRYNIYRATSSGGPYAQIVSNLKWSFYTDNTAANGAIYYYVVTALNSLENESGYSNQAAAAPVSGGGLGLVAEYKFENTAQDTSGNGFNGILSGVTSYVAGQVDSSAINFTGGDDSYVEIPNPVGNDFSLAFWVNTTATGGTGQWWSGNGLVDGEVPGSTNDFGVALVGSNVGFGIGNPDTTITSTAAVNDGQWHHVAATRSGTTGAMQLYVDGVLQATGTASTATRSTPVSLHIGNLQSGYNYLAGSIDEVRIYNYVVSPATVAQLAGNGSTLVANYGFEGNALDSSGFGNNGTTNNHVTYVAGKVGAQAAQFDGLSSYVQIPVPVVNNFSIAYWINTTATAASGQWWAGKGIVDGEVPGAVADFGTSLVGSNVGFGIGNPDTTITSTAAVNDGQWHHVAATRNNTSGAMKLYVDGALQASATGPTGTRSAPPALRVGSIQAGYTGGFFNGAVDDVRIYNYQLSTSQIAALYSPQPLPSPWTNTDIGSPASPGYANYASSTGTWSLGGGGADIWLSADQFQFAYQHFTGDGILGAHLTSGAIISDGTTNANAKAGIMFRDSLATNAPFVAWVHDQSQGLQFLYRDSTGVAAGQQGVNIVTNPAVWLRLVRSNNTFYAYYTPVSSPPTAANWILIGTHTTTLPNSAVAGLVVCSHNNILLANATFAGVLLSPPTPPTISSVSSQYINQNTATAPLAVTIGDALVNASNLVLTASSSNTNLVPNANIWLGGSGSARLVLVTPAAYQSGSTLITLVVNNNQPTANTATNSFLVTVLTSAAGAWRQEYFGTTANTGNAADGADPTGDGIGNVMKRFFGLNPLVAAPLSAWPYPLMVGTNFTYNYTYSLLATDLTWQVQWSPDLFNWWTNIITDSSVSTNGNTEQRKASIPCTTANPLFLRLQVTSP